MDTTWLLPSPAPRETPRRVLTIAGTDSGGGAGIQADSRTFALCGVHGCVAVAAVTVQNTVGVTDFHEIPPAVVAAQVRSVVTDIGISAAKTGMLASAAIIGAVADVCDELGIGRAGAIPLVVDPVCASMHGSALLRPDGLAALREILIPRATVVTPNLDEVRLLTEVEVTDEVSARRAADVLHDLGAQWVVIKGGHLRGSTSSTDLLSDGTTTYELPAERVDTGNDHGAGDTLAAATVAALAHGVTVPEALTFAKKWIDLSLRAAYDLGHGHGPVSPLWRLSVD